MITYQDFGSGLCEISTIGNTASRLFVDGISIVGAAGPFGIWNNGSSFPCWAAAPACGKVGSAFGGAFGALPMMCVRPAKSRLGSVCSPCSSFWSPLAASMALTKVKLTPMPFTSMTCLPACPVAHAEQIGRLTTCRRFALFSRAFLICFTCCSFFRTFSGRGPGQRGFR
eukprot:6179737-Pleurochrysis_carterae.AAC.1